MTEEQFNKNLWVPEGCPDVVLDTDTFNEIDDQFALSYLVKCSDRCKILGVTAAPFHNAKSDSPEDGMEKSYREIGILLKLLGREDIPFFRGSRGYLADESTPQESDASDFLAKLADSYSPEKPLYIVAIGAITNVASAMLKNPAMKENCVVIWLGGHAHHMADTMEFNMRQDVAAARVVMGSGVPFIQLACAGIVDHFVISRWELEHFLQGKNALCDYLLKIALEVANRHPEGWPWSHVFWDVTAVAFLFNEDGRFMWSDRRPRPMPEYDNTYSFNPQNAPMRYVQHIYRDRLADDLFKKLAE